MVGIHPIPTASVCAFALYARQQWTPFRLFAHEKTQNQEGLELGHSLSESHSARHLHRMMQP